MEPYPRGRFVCSVASTIDSQRAGRAASVDLHRRHRYTIFQDTLILDLLVPCLEHASKQADSGGTDYSFLSALRIFRSRSAPDASIMSLLPTKAQGAVIQGYLRLLTTCLQSLETPRQRLLEHMRPQPGYSQHSGRVDNRPRRLTERMRYRAAAEKGDSRKSS
jgi:hypothetical protein